MISGHGTVETAVRATKLGAYDFLEKPLSLDKTLIVVKNAADARRLRSENQELKRQVSHAEIVGDSIPMKALRQQIGLMAPTNGRVLIYGESGTGKELVARAIHAQSLRKDEMFVEVNCAAIPEDLIESELFGYCKGAFPGGRHREGRQTAQGRRRHAVPGRSGRHEFEDAVQGSAHPGRRPLCPGWNGGAGDRGCARDRRHQQGSGGGNWTRQLPRGSVLPAQRGSLRGASAARAQGGHSGAGAALSARVQQPVQPPHQGDCRRGAGRSAALPVAGQRARVAQRDRADRDHEPHGATAGAQAPALGALSRGHAGARWETLPPCTRRAPPTSATTF